MTSAHIQTGFGSDCANTLSDRRGLKGNDGVSSYAGIYAAGNDDVVEYYNLARTGFSTQLMKTATYAQPDACRQAFKRNYPPLALAESVVKQAKHDGDKAYVVGTGGANDTNWASIIQEALLCRGLDWAFATVPIPEKFSWMAGSPDRMIPDGGGCIVDGAAAGQPLHLVFSVEPYNGPTALPKITVNIRDMTNTLLNAGADKVVWMSYYDITPAQIDVTSFLTQAVKSQLSEGVQNKLPDLPSHKVPLIDPRFTLVVQQMVTGMNTAVRDGLPNSPKVKQAPPAVNGDEIQNTMIGGAPHPNGSGHGRMARQLAQTLDGM